MRVRPTLASVRVAMALLALLWTAPAAAHAGGGFGAGFNLKSYGQGQAIVLGAMGVPGPSFSGTELHVNVSLMGIGIGLSLGYEQARRSPADTELFQGGYLGIMVQLRPLALAEESVYAAFDPHITIGTRLGGVGSPYSGSFRATGFIGGGFDVRIAGGELHPVLTVLYRFEPLRFPYIGPDHVFMLGLGVRFAQK